MPSTAHVAFAEGLLQRIRAQNPTAFYVCDPVMGDAPKGLYVPHETAAQIRKQLLPLADVVTPNAFELSWLTGLPVTGIAEAAAAAQALLRPTVIATSVTAPGDRLATLLHDSAGTVFTSVFRQPKAPSGTGDLLTGLLTGAVAAGVELRKALALAGAYLNAVVTASGTSDDLNLTPLFEPGREISVLTVESAT
jgi:pyridoxine kinase